MSAAFNIYLPELSGKLTDDTSPNPPHSMTQTDISYLAELWNAGPIGRAVALQIADGIALAQAVQPAAAIVIEEQNK
jgi:hypothetical protein